MRIRGAVLLTSLMSSMMTIKWGDLCKFNICVSIYFFFANYKMITMGAYQNTACIIQVHEFETLLTFKMQLLSSLKVL